MCCIYYFEKNVQYVLKQSFDFKGSNAIEQILCLILALFLLPVELSVFLFFFLFLCVLYFFLLGGSTL